MCINRKTDRRHHAIGSLSQVDVVNHIAFLCIDYDDNQTATCRRVRCFGAVFGRPFVKRFALCYWTIVLSLCLSVTLVYCGQTVGWIKMKLGMKVGLGPGNILLDGDPTLLPEVDTARNFRPIPVVAKWLDGSMCHLVGS